jgi:hypothetical protein
MCKNHFWHLPIILVILFSYIFFGYTWFTFQYLDSTLSLSKEAVLIVSLFSMGALGGTLYNSIYFAHDYNDSLHDETKNIIPACLDFFGYAIYIIRSGLIAIIFYFLFKAGLFMILIDSKIEINSFATWIIAFSGGFANVKIIKFIDGFVKDTVDPKNKNKKNIIER